MVVRFTSEVKPGLAAAALAVLAGLSACTSSLSEPIRRQQFLLGTSCSISIYQSVPEQIFADAFAEVAAVEASMSAALRNSEVSLINDAAGLRPVAVSRETFDVVKRGLEFSELSGGAFDVTVGPLVRLWGIGTDRARLPAEAEIREARSLVGYRDAVLDAASRSIMLGRSGMRLDLGGIAKGHAADRAAAVLKARGVRHALLDFGGNIVLVGSHPSRPAWRVGIQDPAADRGVYIGLLQVPATSVVTSGAYERFFVQDGVRYHHILDADTGYPVRNSVVSTTVVCVSSTTADALSTSLFVLGPEKGLALAGSVPGVEAMVITEDKVIHLTPGLRAMLTVTDASYSVEGD